MPGPALLSIMVINGRTQLATNRTPEAQHVGNFFADDNGFICSIGSDPNDTIPVDDEYISPKHMTIRQNESGVLMLRDWSPDGTTALFKSYEENSCGRVAVPFDTSGQKREVAIFENHAANLVIIGPENRGLRFELELLRSLNEHGVQSEPFLPALVPPRRPKHFDPFLPMKRNNLEFARTGKGKEWSLYATGNTKEVESSERRQACRWLDQYVGGYFIESHIPMPDKFHEVLSIEDDKHIHQLWKFEWDFWRYHDHPNILPFHGVQPGNQRQLRLLEGDHSGTALHRAKEQPGERLSRQLELQGLKQILTFLDFLHEWGIRHGSISPENIVILDLSNGRLDPRAVVFKLGIGANGLPKSLASQDDKYLAQFSGSDMRALFVTWGILMDLDLRELWEKGETGPSFKSAFEAAIKSKMPELADMVLGNRGASASEYLQLMKNLELCP